VTGAPWEKMREYVTGRVKLSNCSASKAIKDHKDKKMDLTFALVNGKIVVDYVPGIYGVRCDSVVEGFVKGDSSKMNKITFPTKAKCQKEKKCTLSELMAHNNIKKHEQLPIKLGMLDPLYFLMYSTNEKISIYQFQQQRNGFYFLNRYNFLHAGF